METSTRWKIAKCDVINLLVRLLGSIPNNRVINLLGLGKRRKFTPILLVVTDGRA